MSPDDLSQVMVSNLPYLRRYARALTGSQDAGDRYAVATLEALIASPDDVEVDSVKVDLFRTFHKIWSTSGGRLTEAEEGVSTREKNARDKLATLAPNTREALLMHAVEGLTHQEIGSVMGISPAEAEALVNRAFEDMGQAIAGEVLIIEDEAIIAMDLEGIVGSMGHNVTGVARTEAGAIRLGGKTVPDLILADIQLADGSSGIDAVNKLLAEHGDRPVIFITAFPERLLTGDRPEPAFLISKPYSEQQVRAAVSQAMFFATTEGMTVA